MYPEETGTASVGMTDSLYYKLGTIPEKTTLLIAIKAHLREVLAEVDSAFSRGGLEQPSEMEPLCASTQTKILHFISKQND